MEEKEKIDTSIKEMLVEVEGEINGVLPKERAVYLAATEDKHFYSRKAVGSYFTEANNLQELLLITIAERGSLAGDDREKFVQMGVPPEILLPQCRYLYVETKGAAGMVKIGDLAPETRVKVVRTKPGAPCSLVICDGETPEVNFGTIIIGPNERENPDDPEPSTEEMIWTVHPGLPVRPTSADYWPEGSEITAGEVIERLGDQIYLNVRLAKERTRAC